MAVKVETYLHPKKWREHSFYPVLKDAIHVCATKNVAEGIVEQYQNHQTKEFQHIFTIHQVFRKVFYKWHRPEYLLEQYLLLSKIIQESNQNQKLKQSFLYNIQELQDTIRLLVVCNLSSEDIPNDYLLQEKELFFKEIWREYENLGDEVYSKTKGYLSRGSLNREQIIDMLNQLQRDDENQDKEKFTEPINQNEVNLIVLHGFYFITPEQQVFLKYLERSGFDLVFFQLYDKRFESTFGFIRKFISERNGWTDNWNYQSNKEENHQTIGSSFLEMFENKNVSSIQESIHSLSVIKYNSFFDFLEKVLITNYPLGDEEGNKNVSIIATNADILNNLLVQYYPEKFSGRRNFLTYPVGQFLLKLHQMHDNGHLMMNMDILTIAFASGWLSDLKTGENARDYTYELKKISPAFQDCELADEWLERIDYLVTIYDELLPIFKNKGDSRVVKSVENPFTRISYLSIEREKLIQIKRFFEQLYEMANSLFDVTKQETSINSHFSKLTSLMERYNPIYHNPMLQEQEKKLIEILQNKLKQIESDQFFMYNDIENALNFYLSGRFDYEEHLLIRPFIEVDGEIFKDREKVYLTGLDEQGLPLEHFSTPWPFEQKTFDNLANKSRALRLHQLRDESVKQISRYLLYLTFEFVARKTTEYSWIENFLDREDLGPTIYLYYLNYREMSSDSIEDITVAQSEYNRYDFLKDEPNEERFRTTLNNILHEDFLIEYAACPRRFYFGVILDKYTVFQSDFHNKFHFSQLIKFVKGQLKLDDKATKKMVSEIFPHLNSYMINALSEQSLKYAVNYKDLSKVDNLLVHPIRKQFQFPSLTNDKFQEINDTYIKEKADIIHYLKDLINSKEYKFEANPSTNCNSCPFKNDCNEAFYSNS